MSHPPRKFWTALLSLLAITGLLTGMLVPPNNTTRAQARLLNSGTTPPYVQGPFTGQPAYATSYDGDLRDLPQLPSTGGELPAPRPIGQSNQKGISGITPFVDSVAQTSPGKGQMPDPIMNFEGLTKAEGGSWTPPDTNGDVGPNYYIQTVNIAIGIYDKATGAALVKLPYNSFFQTAPPPCNNQNRGDVVVLYDELVDRWLVTDFSLPSTGPVYECLAVSKSGDPVGGGWYFYSMEVDSDGSPWHDYPKLGVWADGWYMSANMFDPWIGARVWALDRASMINGQPLEPIYFDAGSAYGSLLPANLRGALPPSGSPEYFANVNAPNAFNIWQFHTDWANPGASTFTGPVTLQVADYQMAEGIPQRDTGQQLDSLGDRLMMQLQYRNLDGIERLYVTHSVISGPSVGARWYEIHDPGGTPVIFQQGTYQPDDHFRWMGSIVADGEGNIALGYSISSSQIYPAIRYTGRLAGETPDLMTQNEAELFPGQGSQTGSNRWGDYSAMTIDPTDDCTFWYTQEYATTGSNWHTRIGSFKFPSCGAPKGTISGTVYNAVTNQPVTGVPVFAAGSYTFSTRTDTSGHYSMDLIAGDYNLTAGPLLPGYPDSVSVSSVPVSVGEVTTQDFQLEPVPSLVHAGVSVTDPNGNGNGFPEPGEQGINLSEILDNQGAITSTQITAKVTSLTQGVTVNTADTTYPDITAGSVGTNLTPYVFSIDSSLACGADINFQAAVTDSFSSYFTAFSLNASIPEPRQDFFSNDVENGDMGWTTGGTNNTWAITTEEAHSPTHSWTDSPGASYLDNTNSWVRTPVFDLTGKRHVELSGWFKYALESGYDYVYVDYSTNGGGNWTHLTSFNGFKDWHQVVLDASVLDNQSDVALRFNLVSDGGVTEDGIFIDDVALSYEPFRCDFNTAPYAPSLVSPANGSLVTSPVTFAWQAADAGAPTEGFIVYIDDTPVVTFTEPITSTTLDVALGLHSWSVRATNAGGVSVPSETWNLEVYALPNAPSLVSPANGAWVSSPVTFAWQPADSGVPAEGYILYIDETPVMTFTSPITTTILDVSPWAHSWFVKATNGFGSSLPSETWDVNVLGKVFLPITRK